MAFDWTTVDTSTMAVRTGAPGDSRGGVWRQGGVGGAFSGTGALEVWLQEQAKWGFDSLRLRDDADQWLGQMESGHVVLVKHEVFERAECGLENEAGHLHQRLCAGPTAAMRAVQRKAVRAARRLP